MLLLFVDYVVTFMVVNALMFAFVFLLFFLFG